MSEKPAYFVGSALAAGATFAGHYMAKDPNGWRVALFTGLVVGWALLLGVSR
jgi:hypothetical protein